MNEINWILLIILIVSLIALIVAISRIYQANKKIKKLKPAKSKQLLTKKHLPQIKENTKYPIMEKNMLHGQKLQAIGTLAGGIAHDFNNILYAIKGYIEIAREDIPNSTTTYNNLTKILKAANRGQELVARILAFSRRQRYNLEPINLKTIINEALELLKTTIPSSISIKTSLKAKNCIILGSKIQLHQIILNIINNAVDATEGTGTIKIKLSNPKFENLTNIPSTINTKNICKLMISDSGQGIDPINIERIFEPFFTTKEVGKGTGLGLPTVYTIVKEHKGEITVESQQGEGTTFNIFLPLQN